MLYQKNVPVWERALRIISGIVFIGLALAFPLLWGIQNLWMVGGLLFSAAFVILTGFFGWCPACALVGRKLHDEQNRRSPDAKG